MLFPRSLSLALLLLIAILFIWVKPQAQDSCSLRISLLTCTPGEELYSTFGHTAIRVTDDKTGMDIVYNYGTFDDSDPYFYVKFTRGIMLYALSIQSFSGFMQDYVMEHRGITEQILQLDCKTKYKLIDSLAVNALEENRYYNYYFHIDNCTTRARDIIKKNTGASINFKDILGSTKLTFRQLIHTYLDRNGEHWSKFGIDILLGNHLDKHVTTQEAMFLPDYLMKGFDSAEIDHRSLIAKKQTILDAVEKKGNTAGWFTPFSLFVTLFIIIAILSFSKAGWSYTILDIFDRIFFLLIGLLGTLMLLLWLIRVDNVCRNNFNILWALPTHLPIAFIIHRKKSWEKKYFRSVCILTVLLAITWVWLPQQLNTAVAPLLGIIIIRSYYLSKP